MVQTSHETDLSTIALTSQAKEEENDHFIRHLQNYSGEVLDPIVHELNDRVSAAIDCTSCGNCCRSLMINIAPGETEALALYLQRPVEEVKEQYIEESLGGQMIINTIPCHFLEGNKCSIYEHRFTECRDFPHLHKPHFKERFWGTMMHYGSCPIIFNVVEQLKIRLSFIS